MIPSRAHIIQVLRQLLFDHRKPFSLFAIVIIASSVTLSVGLANLGWMRAGSSTPWGVVTGIFVHKDFAHYGGNMAFITLFTVVFVLTNVHFDRTEQRRRVSLFSWTVFIAAVLANVLWILAHPNASEGAYGASGVVYAAMAMATMFALFNAMHHATTLWRSRRSGGLPPMVSAALTAANLLVFLPLFLAARSNPNQFLGVGAGVNVFSHGAAFLMAMPVGAMYGIWWSFKSRGPRPGS